MGPCVGYLIWQLRSMGVRPEALWVMELNRVLRVEPIGQCFSTHGSQPLWSQMALSELPEATRKHRCLQYNSYQWRIFSYEVAGRITVWLGVGTARATVLKGHSTAKGVDHCPGCHWKEGLHHCPALSHRVSPLSWGDIAGRPGTPTMSHISSASL